MAAPWASPTAARGAAGERGNDRRARDADYIAGPHEPRQHGDGNAFAAQALGHGGRTGRQLGALGREGADIHLSGGALNRAFQLFFQVQVQARLVI